MTVGAFVETERRDCFIFLNEQSLPNDLANYVILVRAV